MAVHDEEVENDRLWSSTEEINLLKGEEDKVVTGQVRGSCVHTCIYMYIHTL